MAIVEQVRGPALGERGGDCPVRPVLFSQELCETPENIKRNITATLGRTYEPFNDYLRPLHDGVISIVGSGPSLIDHYHKVTGDILACNAAHDFLISKGVIPKYGMIFDADPVCVKFMTPREDVTYLLASRCHPSLFEHFKGFHVVVWHAMGDGEVVGESLQKHGAWEPIINGGGAAVTMSMGLAMAMGYGTQHLFGGDGSCRGDQTHIKPSLVPEKTMEIFCADKWFTTTPWLANSAEDFKILGPAFRDAGVKIVFHGDGLIPHIARVLGFEVHP